MDFNSLMARMRELDQPTPEQVSVSEIATDECGMDPMGMPSPAMSKPDTQPPSMSLNLNAQGMSDIESLMKLMTKVNPDMINQPSDSMPPMPAMSISPMGLPPLKMLPDFDGDNDDMPGGEMDSDDVSKAQGDLDNDGDHDMDDHDMEKKEKEEAFGNSAPGDEGPEEFDIDAAIPNGNDLHREKKMVKHSYKQGDNPMAMEGNELRAAIRAELLQRLAEAKGAK